MDAASKFEINGTTLTVTSPFFLDDRQSDEKTFLQCIDKIVTRPGPVITIDIVRAGNISSTVIALTIAASRKAGEAKKKIALKVGKRNAIAIRVSGLDKLVAVQLV